MDRPLDEITCGEALGSVASDDFLITDVHYRPGDVYPRHSHARAYLMLVCTGGFREDADRASMELSSGDVIVVPGGHPHRDKIAPAGASGVLVTLERSFAVPPIRWRGLRGGAVSREMIALHRVVRTGGAAELLAIEEHLVRALRHAATELPESALVSRGVRIARDILEAQPEQRLRFGAIARHAQLDPAYLARAFRRSFGRTMGAYLRSVRARRAAELLASSREGIAWIATEAGFADQSHLCRVFRAEYGISPSRYRQLARRSKAFKI